MASWEFTTMESTRNYEQIHCIESILVEVVTIQCVKYILIHFQQQVEKLLSREELLEELNKIQKELENDEVDLEEIKNKIIEIVKK